jgi:hypothetical protein
MMVQGGRGRARHDGDGGGRRRSERDDGVVVVSLGLLPRALMRSDAAATATDA